MLTGYILGISRGHNAGVCLLKDGKIVFAIEEENKSTNSTNSLNNHDKKTLNNYIFNEYDEISLRLISKLAIFKKFGFENFSFSKDSDNFIMELMRFNSL